MDLVSEVRPAHGTFCPCLRAGSPPMIKVVVDRFIGRSIDNNRHWDSAGQFLEQCDRERLRIRRGEDHDLVDVFRDCCAANGLNAGSLGIDEAELVEAGVVEGLEP